MDEIYFKLSYHIKYRSIVLDTFNIVLKFGYCYIFLETFLVDFKNHSGSISLKPILNIPFLAVQHFSFASECCKNLCPSVLGLGRALI